MWGGIKLLVIGILCTKGIHSPVSTDTLAQPWFNTWSTSWSTLDGHLDWYLVNTLWTSRSTPDRHLIDSRLIVGQVLTDSYTSINTQIGMCAKISWLLTDCRPRCWSSNNINGGVNQMSIEYQSSVDQGSQLRASIDSWQQRPLLHTCGVTPYNGLYGEVPTERGTFRL